jgi:membrane-associated phospholipid phosphatase
MSRALRGVAVVSLAAVLFAAPWSPGRAAPAQAADFPYEKDGNAEFWLLTSSAVVGVAGIAAWKRQEPPDSARLASLDRADLWGIDRGATRHWSPSAGTVSDVFEYSMLAAPVVYVAAEHSGEEVGTLYLVYGETLLATNVVNLLLKSVFDRPRPYAYNDDPAIPRAELLRQSAVRSFPSSHTANAFASAVFLGTVYGKTHPGSSGRAWVWVGSLAAATTTGVLRVVAGRHFPTDVVAGAAIGSAAGWLVPKLHERDLPPGVNTAKVVTARPAMPIVSWTVRF